MKIAGPNIPAPTKAPSDLKQASQAFEAIFLRQMLAAARSSSMGDDLMGSQASDTFRQMRDDAFADIASRQGSLGLAAMIEAQFTAQVKE